MLYSYTYIFKLGLTILFGIFLLVYFLLAKIWVFFLEEKKLVSLLMCSLKLLNYWCGKPKSSLWISTIPSGRSGPGTVLPRPRCLGAHRQPVPGNAAVLQNPVETMWLNDPLIFTSFIYVHINVNMNVGFSNIHLWVYVIHCLSNLSEVSVEIMRGSWPGDICWQ